MEKALILMGIFLALSFFANVGFSIRADRWGREGAALRRRLADVEALGRWSLTDPFRPTHRHKDGGLYQFLGRGSTKLHETWLAGVIYIGSDGLMRWTEWARWVERFDPVARTDGHREYCTLPTGHDRECKNDPLSVGAFASPPLPGQRVRNAARCTAQDAPRKHRCPTRAGIAVCTLPANHDGECHMANREHREHRV